MMTREIPIGRTSTAIVDDEDYDYLVQWKWQLTSGGYAARKGDKSKGEKSMVLMHRIIAQTPEDLVCDHINGNRLDNQRRNLRNCTQQQNAKNLHGAWGKVEYKGVTKLLRTRRWRAGICVDGERINLGWFKTPEDAATAYNTVASIVFGEFAALNSDIPTDPNWKSRRLKSASTFINTWEAFLERHPEYQTQE